MTVNTFINTLAPMCQKVGEKFNLLPSLLIAQGCLESSYGTSGLAIKGNNLFGIKGSYNGQSVTMPTREYINSQWETINAQFKKYPSFEECLQDLGSLYVNGVSWDRNHYKPLLGCKDYKQACQLVFKCGYATDPLYPEKLQNVIESCNLTKYDPKPVTVKTVTPAVKPTPKPATPKFIVYTVKPNDNLYTICKQHGNGDYLATAKFNGISNPNLIKVGQQIKVLQ